MEDKINDHSKLAREPNPWGKGRVALDPNKLSSYEKTWIGANLCSGLRTPQFFIENYGLKKSQLSKLKTKVQKRGWVQAKAGPPRKIESPEAKLHIFDKRTSGLQTRAENFDQVLEAARATGKKHGKSTFASETMCPKTKLKYERKYGVKTALAEVTTEARKVACEDCRNFITFGCMNGCMVPDTPQCLVCNMDASTFTVGRDISGKTTIKYFVKEEGCSLKAAPAEKTKGNPIGLYTIKYYLLMGASGTASKPVYVFQDDRMSEEDIEIYDVLGLGIGTDVTSSGYMIFMKQRAGNKAFFSWLNTNVIIPYVNNVRAANNLTKDTPAWFQLDGEDIQIQIYEDDAMRRVLEAENIIIGKPSGSTTEKTQPCDCGNCFKGPKTILKSIDSRSVRHLEAHADRLREVIKEQEHKNKSRGKISANNKNHMVQGLLRVVYALQNSIRPRMIVESFEKAGIWPFDYVKILHLCNTKMSDSEIMRAVDYFPRGVKHIRKYGEISDAILAVNGFGGVSKDHLVKSKRRSIILTSKAFVERELKKREVKAQKKAEDERKRKARNDKASEKRKRQRNEVMEALNDTSNDVEHEDVVEDEI
jgi:hypothetical protein